MARARVASVMVKVLRHQLWKDVEDLAGEVKQTGRKGLLRRTQRRVGEFEFRIALPMT